jgi:hypothetical protein
MVHLPPYAYLSAREESEPQLKVFAYIGTSESHGRNPEFILPNDTYLRASGRSSGVSPRTGDVIAEAPAAKPEAILTVSESNPPELEDIMSAAAAIGISAENLDRLCISL